tara:strand:+ start:668 stop:931 length:264 start_codon:yes stop_codon:yes gene_type:complete
MRSKEEWKVFEEKSNKVHAIVSASLFALTMILGFFLPFFIMEGNGGQMTDGWTIYFMSMMFVSTLSLIWPGLKLTKYFFKKYYIDKE